MNQFLQGITEPQRLQQTGRSPIGAADTPVPDKTAAFDNIQAGKPIPCVVILTALRVEYMAVRKHLTSLKEDLHPKWTVYERGLFTASTQVWDVVIAEIGEGNSGVATEVERAISYFDPTMIFFIGVAGGIRKELNIGDVVVGTKIYKYESGKVLADRTLSRPTLGNSSYSLDQRAKAEAKKSDWLARIQLGGSDTSPSVYIEPIASGEKVLASSRSSVYKYLQEHYDDAYAIDMESYGFLEASWRNSNVGAIVIRGISDKLDKKAKANAAGSKQLAASNASAFAFEMLAKLDGSPESTDTVLEKPEDNVGSLQEDNFGIDPDKKPPAEIAILRFYQHTGSYKLYAHHAEMDTLDKTMPEMTLPKVLGQFGTTYPWSIDTVGDLENYQPRTCLIGLLLKWLRNLQKKEPNFVCLVISEPRNSIVPWELLNLKGQPLGVVLQTVRSHLMLDDDEMEEEIEKIRESSYCCQGQALMYTPVTRLDSMATYFPGGQAYAYESFSHDEPEQILVHLQTVEIKVGLLVMADLALQQVSSGRRKGYLNRTKILRETASLVMLQLAVSGEDKTGHQDVAEAFLENGAKGVLSMLENVDRTIAQQIMNDFFTEYERDPDLPIPEIMRRLRVTISQRLNDQLTDEMSRLYLATFMYGYYGHPMTVLKLTPASP
jgi:nucleoside phosphorylase